MGGEYMPDYKEMYFTLYCATEKAINTLIIAQQECEEMYCNNPKPNIQIVPEPNKNKKSNIKK